MTIRIHRSEDAGWTKLANVMLRDSNLTLRAKGLLAQLLSHEDGWQQSLAYAEKQCDDGRHVVAAAFGELMSAGYATRARAKDHTGKFRGWDYDIYDTPVPAETSRSTVIGNTVIGNTDIGESGTLEEPQPLEEPLEQKNPETALAPTSSTRKRDVIWDTFVECYGEPTDLNRGERGGWNTAAKALRDYGAEPEQIRQMIRDLHGTTKSWAVDTPLALAKHFGQRDVYVAQVRANGKGTIGTRSRQLADELRRQGQ